MGLSTPTAVRSVLCMAAFVSAAAAAWATQVRPLNVEDLVARADRIVEGRCLSVQTAEHPVLGLPILRVRVAVERNLKGTAGPVLEFETVAGAGSGIAGLAGFRPGEEIVLFLYPDSAKGLTSPVGLGQGKFVKRRTKEGREVAVNALGNGKLFRDLSHDALRKLGTRVPGPQGQEALSPSALVAVVEALVDE